MSKNSVEKENEIIKNIDALVIEKNRLFLETPIIDEIDDNFGAITYSEQLYYAIKKGAKFIAVDGEYGTGKSSIINLFKTKMCDNKTKNIFLNINFININNTLKKRVGQKNQEELRIDDSKEDIINKYHRYFVNQVGSSLYKNPYDVEKTFYNNYFGYTTISLKQNSFYKKIIDVILLILIGFVSLYLIYSGFFKSVEMFDSLYKISTNIMPYILFVILVLLILYGYGFYKPEKVEKSPMLDIDKCKNNLCKVLYNVIPKNGNVYFIIDDLDRIDKNLQLPIISLLYNEYYHLESVLDGINVKFIFMIDLNKVDSNNQNDINSDKLFDYILNVANNQPIILRNYIEKQIVQNEILNDIFSKVKNKDYIIGIIANNYNSIRKVKHLFNRIITKYIYLNNKKIKNISYSQLLIISILMGFDSVESLNTKLNGLINGNQGLGDSFLDIIIKEAYIKNMLDNNYYIYLTNFIDINNILNSSEQVIYDVANNPFSDEENWSNAYKVLEGANIDFSKIYNQIYKYLPNNGKILLLGDKNFYKYINKNYSLDVDTTDFYKNYNISIKFQNYNEYEYFLDKKTFFRTLDNLYYEYINSTEVDNSQEAEKFWYEFKIFIGNLKNNIEYYDITKYLDVGLLPNSIFNLLLKQKKDNISVLYRMLVNEKIKWNSIKEFIDINIIKEICEISDENIKLQLENHILKNTFDLELKKYIILKEDIVFDNIEVVYDDFRSSDNFNLNENDLKKILDKYGYNSLLDKFIIDVLNIKSSEDNIIEYIKSKQYELSFDILKKIDSLTTKYGYSDYYEKQFKQKGYYKLLLYSNMINNHRMSVDSCLANRHKYIEAINKVYVEMDDTFKEYTYSQGITNKIVNNFDFSKIDYDKTNFWKIDILIPSLKSYTKCLNLFNRLNEINKLNDYISHCRNNAITNDNFFENMRMYAQNINLSPGIKSNITKLIIKPKEKIKN